MTDRKEYAKVRQQIIDMIRTDLMGPSGGEEEVLSESPRSAYIVGMLSAAQEDNDDISFANEQEVDSDIDYADSNDYSGHEQEDEETEPVTNGRFKIPSSMGISFYVESDCPGFQLDIMWGDYVKSTETLADADGKGKSVTHTHFRRVPVSYTLTVDFAKFSREYRLPEDSNIHVHITRIPFKTGYSLVTAYVINRRNISQGDVESMMFQVSLKAYSADGNSIFCAENLCRENLERDEFYFKQRPIMGRGHGCAATWDSPVDGHCRYVASDSVPQYEFPGVSSTIEGFDPYYFSMRCMMSLNNKAQIFEKLKALADAYEGWIKAKLEASENMQDTEFKEQFGQTVIEKCRSALNRIRDGISLLERDSVALDAFFFMNRVMLLQRCIMNFARVHGQGIECAFGEFSDLRKKENDFAWRPFQIAFILLNLNAIVNPCHHDRDIVDLLYFPTGGGKTEAYLGLMAFVIANRRLRNNAQDEYNRDGGVTVILRYTLRLLTTQQRDRITKMVVAAEYVRRKCSPKYGSEPISIGFWVGSSMTPNYIEKITKEPTERRNLYNQLLTCPFCGKQHEEADFRIDPETKSVKIYCSDKNCIFYPNNQFSVPVYLVDEEIYARCPTIILSTVDKFAGLPWNAETNALFGRVDQKCTRHGFLAAGISKEHSKTHRATDKLPAARIEGVKPFLPPELIVQDELHLITGPLGTIYGAYETVIDDLCSYQLQGKTVKPKYIASTATIKNAGEQAKCLYARKETEQFPANGFEIGDSFFIRELPVEVEPFRKYVGICAPGQSVKTALLRIYAIILQVSHMLANDEATKDFIDPYYTLIGYFNSIRELGGAVRLLQDDIPKRIKRIYKRYEMGRAYTPTCKTEITSRMSSYDIPKRLKLLEVKHGQKDCLDTAIATNMIGVGMDVERLGLMVVAGQPKQNSEYIQATSRIGRAFPGIVVTLYSPYRPRDLSHYENFTGYHAQLYRFVEGTTATPFSARARDRVLHALIISALRLKFPDIMASNDGALKINDLTYEKLEEVKRVILDRLNIIKPAARADTETEIEAFIGNWKRLASNNEKPLHYTTSAPDKYNRLMSDYGESHTENEKATLRSMRDVENEATMYYYKGE